MADKFDELAARYGLGADGAKRARDAAEQRAAVEADPVLASALNWQGRMRRMGVRPTLEQALEAVKQEKAR